MSVITALAAGTAVAGAGVAAAGTIAQGNAAVDAAKQEQRQLNQMAAEQKAVATRDAASADRKTRELLSRAQAVAAASGGNANDPTVLQIMGDIAAEGSVQSREALRQGWEQGNSLEYKGKVGVEAAKTSRKLGVYTATGQVLSGISDAFAKYGAGMPSGGSGGSAPSGGMPTADYNWWQEPGYRQPRI